MGEIHWRATEHRTKFKLIIRNWRIKTMINFSLHPSDLLYLEQYICTVTLECELTPSRTAEWVPTLWPNRFSPQKTFVRVQQKAQTISFTSWHSNIQNILEIIQKSTDARHRKVNGLEFCTSTEMNLKNNSERKRASHRRTHTVWF